MTDIQQRAYAILKKHPDGIRGSDVGWMLWGATTECARRGTGSHRSNKFCRPAGKVLNQLQRDGKARWQGHKGHSRWYSL